MNKSVDKYIIDFVVILVFVFYFQIFKFIFIPSSIRNLSQLFICGLIILLILIRIIYFNENYARMNFKGPILLILLGSIPSIFYSYYYHNQSIVYSLYANKVLFFYLFYFFLHAYKVPVNYLLRVIIIVGLIAAFLYYIQLFLYPRLIMDIRSDESRGTLRLFVPGLLCTIAAYFYFLNKFFQTNKLTILFLGLVCFSCFILQGTRQLIFGIFFLTIVNLILVKRIKSKLLMLFLISLASFSVFLIFQEIFLAIFKVSSSQSEGFSGDIRVRAAKFFLTDFMPTDLAYITGNGKSGGTSIYDIKMAFYMKRYGFYLSDIGIIGDYTTYGVFFLIGSLTIIFRTLTIKVDAEYIFLKYYLLAMCFTLLTGSGFLGDADIVLISILYVFDIHKKPISVQNYHTVEKQKLIASMSPY